MQDQLTGQLIMDATDAEHCKAAVLSARLSAGPGWTFRAVRLSVGGHNSERGHFLCSTSTTEPRLYLHKPQLDALVLSARAFYKKESR